jgi:hypothetical protein
MSHNLQSICARCGHPIYTAKHNTTINPDGLIEVRITCPTCDRKWYGIFGIEQFIVLIEKEGE